MKGVILGALLGLASAQNYQCVYHSGNYTLNLTAEAQWTLEKETSDAFYYYTPCRNGLRCQQGNADFYSNAAEFRQGQNQCLHYLSVDHHEAPSYSFYGAAWRFSYQDGELCDVTQQPRRNTIYYHCNEEENRPIEFYDINEPQTCNYVIDIRGNAACVPESSHNSNCQWRVPNPQGGYFYLDLSALNNETIFSRLPNGYFHEVSPCRNSIPCWQQYPYPVMAVINNHQTGTCEHYGAIWEDGRVQPMLHNQGTPQEHWSFHYFNGESCSNGQEGEEELRFFCDPTVPTWKVMNTTGGNCHFDINVATQYACTNTSVAARKAFFGDRKLPSWLKY